MRLTLRKKFFIFNLLFLSVLGLLIYVLNTPYREMKSLMNDVRHDITQIMEAEKFVRTVYEQQHEVAKLVLGSGDMPDRKEFDRLSGRTAELLGQWEKAFGDANFPADTRADFARQLNDVEETGKQIQDLSESAISFAKSGKQMAAVRTMAMIDSRIRQKLLPKADYMIRELQAEVEEDLPLLFSSLQQTAVIPIVKTSIHLTEMLHELRHALQIQKISRFYSSQYLGILHVAAGSADGTEIRQFADFRKIIHRMLDEWTKEYSEERGEEEKKEDAREIEAISSMRPLFDRLEKAGAYAIGLSGMKDSTVNLAGFREELNEIDSLLAGQFDLLVTNEEHEINKRIDAVVRVVDRARTTIFAISLMIAFLGILTLWYLFSNMISPVLHLRDASMNIGRGDFTSEIVVRADDEIGDLAKSFNSMRQDLGDSISKLKDEIITRKRAEAEKEDMIIELRLALGKIRTLSGLLPICASCKKIRDDRGYWNQIEAFISEHSEAEFSHGYCPECAAKFREEIELLKKSPSGGQLPQDKKDHEL